MEQPVSAEAVGSGQQSERSQRWLVSTVIGDGAARPVAGAVFLVPTVGFLVAAAGLLIGQPWRRGIAVASAALSMLGTALYPNAFPTGSTIGSVAVNLVVLYGILVAGWGAEAAAI
jgi:hypothetical protein